MALSVSVSVICDISLFLAMTKGEKTYGYSVYVYSLIFFVDICLMQGKTSEHIHICYTCSLQGEFLCAQLVIIKKGENIVTYILMRKDFDDNKYDAGTLELNLKS